MTILTDSTSGITIVPTPVQLRLGEKEPVYVSSELSIDLAFAEGEPTTVLRRHLSNAIERVAYRIVSRTTRSNGIRTLRIQHNGSPDASLVPTISTDETYTIDWNEERIFLNASSTSGIVYGLETIAQLVFSHGTLPAISGDIQDEPRYPHRGLLVDSGRRFWPLDLLKQTVDALAAVKMNVLHYHFSDNCRFAIQSDNYPEIIPSDGQFLTKDQVRELIEYASLRGVRIVPEIDLPGHARGMRNAPGVTWVDDEDRVQMSDSRGTREFLQGILTEFAELFPDENFHIGADETNNAPAALIEYAIGVLADLGKKVIGWEEAYFKSSAGTPEDLILQLWKSYDVPQTDDAGFKSLYSKYTNLYLDLRPTDLELYININPAGSRNVLGGEVAMWTDNYCPKLDCYSTARPLPPARHMFTSDMDQEFIDSINRMMWVKTAVAACTFWNFRPEINPQHDLLPLEFLKEYLFSNFLIRACVDNDKCRCSELHGCSGDNPPLPHYERPPLAPVPAGGAAKSGIFSIRFTSWGSPGEPLFFTTYTTPENWPTGDLTLYFVDAYYSSPAFSDSDGMVRFLTRYRRESAITDSTVYFVYDDGGKNDPVLLREYMRQFFGWYNALERAVKETIGLVGIGVNVEKLSAEDLEQVVNEEFEGGHFVRLQIVLYDTQSKDLVQTAIQLADSVLVHISHGNGSVGAMASSITTYLDRNRSGLESTTRRGYISFALQHTNAVALADPVYRRVIDSCEYARVFLNKKSFISPHPWESLV